ncbi:MAG: hypothetical protein WDO13_16655 [Verrucomicrobiota bacterium]
MKTFFVSLLILVLLALAYGVFDLRTQSPGLWNAGLEALRAPIARDSSVPVAPERVVIVAAPAPPVAPPAPPPPKQYVAPYPLPAQPNWKWTVLGHDYNDVVITKTDADLVAITYEGGAGTVRMADLPPDLQKLLNYDPELAAAAARTRSADQARVDAEQAPKIASMLAEQRQQADAEAAERAQKIRDENARVARDLAVDQARQRRAALEDDLSFVSKHVSVDQRTGAVSGDNYFLTKYQQDTSGIAQCNQVINSSH